MDVLNTKIKNIKDEKALKVRPENIKNGVSIFGIQGTYTGLDTSDANATAGDILQNKTAYVNGTKITGSIVVAGSGASATATSANYNSNAKILSLGANFAGSPMYINNQYSISSGADRIVNAIGLTADKIKKDEVVLGITGTYEGSGSSSFDGIYPSPHNSVQDPDARMYNARLQDIEMWDTGHKFLLHTHECWNDNNYYYEDDEGGERGELIDEEHFYGLTAEIYYQGEPLTTGTQVDISFNIVDNSNNVLFTCTGTFWDDELSAVYRTVPFSFDSNADGTFSKNAFERGYNIKNFVCTITVEE